MTTFLVVVGVLVACFVAFAAMRQRRTKSKYSAYYGRNIDVQRYDYGKDHRTGI